MNNIKFTPIPDFYEIDVRVLLSTIIFIKNKIKCFVLKIFN
jgi:hypothetical protein